MLLTNYIKRLCNAHPSEKDRRITYVELTEAGKTLIEEIFRRMQSELQKHLNNSLPKN